MRLFPVLHNPDKQDAIRNVPWDMLAPYEERIRKNHRGLPMEVLSQCHGMTQVEVLAAMDDLDTLDALRRYVTARKDPTQTPEQVLISRVKEWYETHKE